MIYCDDVTCEIVKDKPEPITGEWIKKIDFTHTYDEMADEINKHFLGKE